jgi:hypothetical protein
MRNRQVRPLDLFQDLRHNIKQKPSLPAFDSPTPTGQAVFTVPKQSRSGGLVREGLLGTAAVGEAAIARRRWAGWGG